MDEFSLNNDFEMIGFWWLPESPDTKMPGILKHEPTKGITLEVWKETDAIEFQDLLEAGNTEIIQGVAHFSKQKSGLKDHDITLVSSFIKDGSYGTPLTRKVFYVNHAFVGTCFNKINDIRFDKLTFELENLEKWIQYLPYKQNMILNDKNNLESISFNISKETHPVKTHKLHNMDYECTIVIHPDSVSFNSFPKKKVIFGFTPVLEIKPERKASYDNLKDVSFSIVYLLTLLIGKPLKLNAIRGFLKAENENIHIYSRPTYFTDKDFEAHDVMLPFPKVEENFEKILNIWFDKEDNLAPIIYLLMESFYYAELNPRRMFLDMMQAFETFDREVLGNKKIKCFKTNKLRAFYLKERFLNQLLTMSTELKKYICHDDEQFSEIIVDTRNYFTHFSKEKKEKALNGLKLYWT